MTLGDMIRSQRESRDLTQREFADLLYVTRQTVSRWESGSRCPDLIMAKKIADIFGISLDELISGSDVESYIPAKITDPDIRKLIASVFLLVLAVWMLVCGAVFSASAFAVISAVLVFVASIVFIFGYFKDSEGTV